jgi:hypothetical protein
MGIADFQRTVTQGISEPLLKWKAIEVAHELSKSPNTKVVILGDKTGLVRRRTRDTISHSAGPVLLRRSRRFRRQGSSSSPASSIVTRRPRFKRA